MEKMRRNVLLLYYSEETCYVSDGENAAKFFIFVLLWRSTCYVDTCLILWIIWLYSCSAGCVSTKGFGTQIIIAARSFKKFIVLILLALEKFAEYTSLILWPGRAVPNQTKYQVVVMKSSELKASVVRLKPKVNVTIWTQTET